MAKIIPPASVLYFQRGPILISAPVKQKAALQDAISIWKAFEASGGTFYYVSNIETTVCELLLATPGDYQITFEWHSPDSACYVKVYLNDNLKANIYGTSSNYYGTATITLYNVPGYSILRIVAKGISSATPVGLRNLKLKSSRNADFKVLSIASLLTQTLSTTTATPQSVSTNENAPQPPPIRDVSNKPVKRQGGWLLP